MVDYSIQLILVRRQLFFLLLFARLVLYWSQNNWGQKQSLEICSSKHLTKATSTTPGCSSSRLDGFWTSPRMDIQNPSGQPVPLFYCPHSKISFLMFKWNRIPAWQTQLQTLHELCGPSADSLQYIQLAHALGRPAPGTAIHQWAPWDSWAEKAPPPWTAGSNPPSAAHGVAWLPLLRGLVAGLQSTWS